MTPMKVFNIQQIFWGESSFKNFWADQGFDIFERLVHKYPDTLEEIKIKDEKGKQYTPEEFLGAVGKLNIIRS